MSSDTDEKKQEDTPEEEPVVEDEAAEDLPTDSAGEADETGETGEKAAETPEPSTSSETKSDEPLADTWVDKWWVWALGGLAFAGFIGLLHVLT
jgi:hypothetical protein